MIRAAVLGSAALAVAVATPVFAESMVRIDGRVVDQKTMSPLIARLAVADHTGHTVIVDTDGNGRFAVVGLEPGRVTIRVDSAAPDYWSARAVTCDMPPGETGRLSVDVNVYDTAVFSVYRPPGAAAPPRGYVDGSDAAGYCKLEPSTVDRYNVRSESATVTP
jgi:hypothetical protein